MRTARRPVEPGKTTARPVLTIHVDIGQLVAAIRRHVLLTPKASRAIQEDLARLFDATCVVAVSSAGTGLRKAADDPAPQSKSKGPP